MCVYLQDLLFILLISCAFGAAGVLGALTTTEWNENYVKNPYLHDYEDDLVAIKRDTTAVSVSLKN